MLRRITSGIGIISLMLAILSPLTAISFASGSGNRSTHTRKKAAPEFGGTNNSSVAVRVLIQTKGAPSAAQDAAIAGARGHKRANHDALNTVVADVPLNEIAALAARDDIEYIAPDRPVKAQFNLTNEAIGADQVQTGMAGAPGLDGKGITIAI